MNDPLTDYNKAVGKIKEVLKNELKTLDKCEDYCFWKGVTIFLRTVNDSGDLRCSISNKAVFSVAIVSHRPQRIQISLTSTPEKSQVKFGEVRSDKWEVDEEINPDTGQDENTDKHTRAIEKELYPDGGGDTESVVTDIEQVAHTEDGPDEEQAEKVIHLRLL